MGSLGGCGGRIGKADIACRTLAVGGKAAGAHHLMMTGPPGIGKTMLAQRLPGLLPTLTEAEALEAGAMTQPPRPASAP